MVIRRLFIFVAFKGGLVEMDQTCYDVQYLVRVMRSWSPCLALTCRGGWEIRICSGMSCGTVFVLGLTLVGL
jgi:hypothetical protein